MATSVFDLVTLSTLKLILVIILLTELERLSIIRLYRPVVDRSFILKRNLLIVVLVLVAIGSLTFVIIKLILVLRQSSLSKLNLSAVCIFLILSSLESIGILWTCIYLSQLKLIEQQRSVDSRTKTVNLRRVFWLV
jgi:hypothetical protein